MTRMEHLTRSIACTERNYRLGPRPRKLSPIPHGTATGYVNRGCRCEPCRVAVREYRRDLNAKRQGIPKHKHGTVGGYSWLGCRCEACRTAYTAWAYERRHVASVCQCGAEVPKGRLRHCSRRCQEYYKPCKILRRKRAARLRYFRKRYREAA